MRNKKGKATKYIIAALAAVVLFFCIFESPLQLKLKFRLAIATENYDKAFSYTNLEESRFITPQSLKDVPKFISIRDIECKKQKEKKLLFLPTYKLDFPYYIIEPRIILPKNSRLYINDIEIKQKEDYGVFSDCFIIGKTWRNYYNIKVYNPMLKVLDIDDDMSKYSFSEGNNISCLYVNEDNEKLLSREAFENSKKIIYGSIHKKDFDSFNFPDSKYSNLESDYKIIADEISSEALKEGYLLSDISITNLDSVTFSEFMSDSYIFVMLSMSAQYSLSEITSSDSQLIKKEDSNLNMNMIFNYENGKWILTGCELY